MRLALGSSQRPLLNTPPSRVAVSEDAEDNAYPPLSPLQRSSATPSQPPVHSPLQEFITPRETFTGATATQAASPPHMTTNNLFSSEEEVESPSKRLARTPRQLPEPTPVNQLPASQPSGNRSSSSSDNSGSRPSQSPHGPWGNPGGDPASSSDSDGVPDDEADTGGPPGDVSDADSNDSERHVALMISVGSVLSWQLPTEGSQLHGGSVSHTKAWLLMMKSYIVNIKRDLAVEELWEQMMVQVYENSQPFVLFTDNRAAWIQECNALQTQSSLNGVLQVNEHGQPIMNPATWKLKLIHFYELVKTGLALALKVTPLDAKEEYEKFDCYDNAGLLYPMPRILMSEFTKKYEEFDIRAGQPHYREAMAKVAKLLDRMAPTLKENFGSYKDVTPLGCWAIAKLYKLDQDQHTLERLTPVHTKGNNELGQQLPSPYQALEYHGTLPKPSIGHHKTLLMDEMTVLQRDLDLMFREVQNLHEFNRALQLSPSTATLLQGTEPSYGVPYLANLSHQTGLSFKSTTGLLQCVNLMVLVDTGSGLNFISQSMADSLGQRSSPMPPQDDCSILPQVALDRGLAIQASISNQAAPSMLGRRHEPGIQKSYRATKTAVSIGRGSSTTSVSSNIGLRIHPDKSCFALDAVDFLGFDVSTMVSFTPQAAKVQAIQDLPYPSNLKDLKTILGHIVDYVLTSDLSYPSATTTLACRRHIHGQNGITLYEMCGGMCAGLEAALRNGIQVNSPPLAPGRQLDTDLRLAAMSKDTDGLDIHSDQFVLRVLEAWSPRIQLDDISGNTMLMHAVEYFSAALVVVPIPAKEPYIRYTRTLMESWHTLRLAMTAPLPDLTDSTQVQALTGHSPGARSMDQEIPVEDWFCPNCKASGITAIPAGRIPETPQKEPNLFPTPQTRSRDRAGLACDKMLVIKQVRVQGGLDKAVWGTASFQGPLSRPWHPTHTILAS
eukprot:gene18055-biopygen27006